MTKPSSGSVRSDSGGTFLWATALFAVLCGVLLLTLGGTGDVVTAEAQEESVKSVVIEIDAATNALEDKDYGRAKAFLRSARKRLSRLED